MLDVIIACGGSSSRMGRDKLLLPLEGGTVLSRTVAAFQLPFVKTIVIPCRPEAREFYADELSEFSSPVIVFCDGGATRAESVQNALKLCSSRFVAVHDGARPFVSRALIETGYKLSLECGSAVPCISPADSVRLDDENGSTPLDRNKVKLVQTPQFFNRKKLTTAYAYASKRSITATDDAQIFELTAGSVTTFEGDARNVKITSPSDLVRLVPERFRVGSGWDLHTLVKGRDLILGGVRIDYHKGLLGHSDADVLTHAVMDAVLGALGRGDIGKLFPDDDPSFEGADSIALLRRIAAIMHEDGYSVNNLSVTVICERPRLSKSIWQMETNLADALGCDPVAVNIAATTSERTGAIGKNRAIAASAYVSLISDRPLFPVAASKKRTGRLRSFLADPEGKR